MNIFKLKEEYLKNTREQQEKNLNIHNSKSNSPKYNFDSRDKSENINELIRIMSDKINKIEIIDPSMIDEIYMGLKNICSSHNKKIYDWYDEKYFSDLNEFKLKNNSFFELMKTYEQNSFVLVEEN